MGVRSQTVTFGGGIGKLPAGVSDQGKTLYFNLERYAMGSTPQGRAVLPTHPLRLGRIGLTSATVLMAFSYAAYIVEQNVSASPSLVGVRSGTLVGALTVAIVKGTTLRRLAFGLVGFIASLTIVIDITGQFVIVDGRAKWLGAVGLMAVSGVVLSTGTAKNELTTGILYRSCVVHC